MFVYTDYTDFKTDTNILNGTLADEVTLNKSANKLKKELNKVYNEQQLQLGGICVQWREVENYDVGEFVSDLGINYICLVANVDDKPPSINWKVAKANIVLLPAGDNSERPPLDILDKAIRYNTEEETWEAWDGLEWGTIGGGSGQMLGEADIKAVSYNAQVIAENIVVPAGLNAYSAGDITVENGFTVTVENTGSYKIL